MMQYLDPKLDNVRIISSGAKIDLGIKRFYVPIEIEWKCPKCGERVIRDLQQSYLSYPSGNVPITIWLHCHHCEERRYSKNKDGDEDEDDDGNDEYGIRAILHVSLELLPTPSDTGAAADDDAV